MMPQRGHTPELRAKLSEVAARNWADPEYRARVLAKRQATLAIPERRAAFVAACQRAAEDATINDRRAAAMKAKWSCPDYRARVLASRAAAIDDPAVKRKKSVASKAVWQRPDYQAKISEARKAAWTNGDIRRRILSSRAQFHLKRRGLEPAPVTWSGALDWAARIDPDMVLRGSRADRLAAINELREVEGLGPFVLVAA